jgi:hypothetical protein
MKQVANNQVLVEKFEMKFQGVLSTQCQVIKVNKLPHSTTSEKVKFSQEQATKAQRGSRDIVLLLL